VDPALTLRLSDAIKEYLTREELIHLCELFDIEFDASNSTASGYASFCTRLIKGIELGNNRPVLGAILETLLLRARRGVAQTDWERRDYHREMVGTVEGMQNSLGSPAVPSQVSVPAENLFTAKSRVREFLDPAETEVLVVDNWIGPETLDCLRDVKHRIRILTGDRQDLSTAAFDRALRDFQGEGRDVQVRRHPKLHDRYLVFNGRCWLVGSSLKDAGKKELNVLELVDGRASVLGEIEAKWAAADEYKPST
jgi:hypothetical protein